MAGHLFVVRGDLRALACDAVLVPSGTWDGRTGHVGNADWHELLDEHIDGSSFVTPAPTADQRVVRVVKGKGRRSVWVGHTGDDDRSPRWYGKAVGAFVREAARPRLANRPLGDARPLLATPLVGIGAGGMRGHKGEVVLAIVRAIRKAQRRVDADVVVVCHDAHQYAAVQQARRRICGDDLWSELTAAQVREAGRLAAKARDGRLVLFVGAGASLGAGAPSWKDLLRDLADRAGIKHRWKELERLDARDAAAVFEQRLGTDGLRREVVRLTDVPQVALTHQLLASLPVDEAVTTNYDTCLERAMAAAGRPAKVLPGEHLDEHRRWVLKLHGSVDRPQDIVLSRDDYLRFEGTGTALAGVVQALLLTRHMLFVGYGLQDDNFHRLVHQVRGTLADRSLSSFATALTPADSSLLQDLWQRDVRYVSTARKDDGAVRRLAMLLDRLGAEAATPGAQLLDRSYAAMFTKQERALRKQLLAAEHALEGEGISPAVREAFRRRG